MSRTPYIFPFQIINIDNTIHFEGQIIHVAKNINTEGNSLWKNLKRTYQVYTPKKIKQEDRQLKIVLDKQSFSTPIDKFGYFHMVVDVTDSIIHNLDKIIFYIGNSQIFINKEVGNSSSIIDSDSFDFGVISDIDDTVIVSHSTNKIKKAALVALKNAKSRKVVGETVNLFDTIKKYNCQFFYVSNSETNLYLLIKWILKLNKLPDGPIYLRGVKNYRSIFKGLRKNNILRKYDHKISRIERLLNYFPSKQFILIGDSSQGDPEIYKYISYKYPERIKAVLIRNITGNKRKEELTDIGNYIKGNGIHFKVYSKNSSIIDNIDSILK